MRATSCLLKLSMKFLRRRLDRLDSQLLGPPCARSWAISLIVPLSSIFLEGKTTSANWPGSVCLSFGIRLIETPACAKKKNSHLTLLDQGTNLRFDDAKTKRQLRRNFCVNKALETISLEASKPARDAAGKLHLSVSNILAFVIRPHTSV